MTAGTLSRYWHTLRHLRPAQFRGRARMKLVRPRPDLSPAPPLRAARAVWQCCERRASMSGPATLRLVGVERTLASPGDWDRADWPRLWRYNAHYFDDLAASDADAREPWHRALVARWVAENPPGRGSGWEPYPVSLRIVNWIKWAIGGHALDAAAAHSLAVQARWLSGRLEVHLLGNHLWANAKALVFAGTFFDGGEADVWRERGLALLRREIVEQVLPDGGHFELSPMYHALVLEDVLDLVQLARVFRGVVGEAEVRSWREAAVRMLRWLRVMSHPDGGIALFNDAAWDVAPALAALERYARLLDVAVPDAALADVEPLPASGYVRLQAGAAVLIADLARVGPDYLPGHAHADTLSFELSLGAARVLVNGGTSTYEAGPERGRERGTPMHNTVTVDGADSSEVWSAFRVARRARPFDVRWGRGQDGTVWVEGAHDGYRRLAGRVVHRRRWELGANGLAVIDRLEGRCGEAVARFRFAPGLMVTRQGEAAGGTVGGAAMPMRWSASGASAANVSPGTWHARFGTSEDVEVLSLRIGGGALETRFDWD